MVARLSSSSRLRKPRQTETSPWRASSRGASSDWNRRSWPTERASLTIADIDRWEINEAFAGQAVACIQDLGLDIEKVNVNGGAVGLGHPLAATGTRLVLTLAHELQRCGGRYGVATACIGGGQGIAMVIEAL